MAENKLKKTINNSDVDLEATKSPNFFTGVNDLRNLYLDPIVTGWAFIWWIQLPSWFEKDPDLKYFKNLTQKNFKGFNGVTETELTTLTHTTGFAGAEYDVVGGISRGNQDFTITHNEWSGSVMRKLYQKWQFLVRDPRTGISTYPKLFNVDYGARNHTGQLLYVMVRPDVNNKGVPRIEYAALYTNVFPTTNPLGTLYNYDDGNQESPTVDINFKGFAEFGPDVETFAQRILDEEILGDGGIRFIDANSTDPEAGTILKDILGIDD